MNIPSVKKTTAMYNKYPGADTGGRGTFAPPEFGIFVPIFRIASQ